MRKLASAQKHVNVLREKEPKNHEADLEAVRSCQFDQVPLAR